MYANTNKSIKVWHHEYLIHIHIHDHDKGSNVKCSLLLTYNFNYYEKGFSLIYNKKSTSELCPAKKRFLQIASILQGYYYD